MKKLYLPVVALIVLSLTPASGGLIAPSDYWQIIYREPNGDNAEATVAGVAPSDALAAFEKEFGDKFITCLARTDQNQCRRRAGF